jgi:hypothetical protein
MSPFCAFCLSNVMSPRLGSTLFTASRVCALVRIAVAQNKADISNVNERRPRHFMVKSSKAFVRSAEQRPLNRSSLLCPRPRLNQRPCSHLSREWFRRAMQGDTLLLHVQITRHHTENIGLHSESPGMAMAISTRITNVGVQLPSNHRCRHARNCVCFRSGSL